MITVFYDGKCGLCRKEINYYRRIAPANIFHWQDITVELGQLQQANISLAQGLKFLHVLDAQQQWHVGVNAFIIIWSQLNYWRWLAKFVALPIVRPVVSLVYRLFAHWRFKRLDHCRIAK